VEQQETAMNAGQRSGADERSRQEARERLAEDIIRAGHGDEAAMERAYKQTSAKIYAVLLEMLTDRATADEVLQDTYLAVWRGAHRFTSGRASPMSWLIAIARNKGIDRLRGERLSRRSRALDDLAVEPSDPHPSVLVRIEADEDRDRLHWCIDQLEARQRDAIRTAFFSGMTYDDLARRSGVPLGTMKSWIRRGLLRLKACLEP
jgi:RNA polymerase sigma-70 factor, ECF subfamily